MTIEELKNAPVDSLDLEQLQTLADHYERESAKYTAYEQAVKVTLNSIYGAFGNKWFHFFNIDIAESITLQGQNAILYSEKILNRYAQDFWHKDTKLHEQLGLTVKGQCHKPAVIYIDTDSCYVQFDEMYRTCDQLLAGSALTGQQHRRRATGDPYQTFLEIPHGLTMTDNLLYIVECCRSVAGNGAAA